MLREGSLFIRTVVDSFGGVEAMRWIRARPGSVARLADGTASSPRVRYLAATNGKFQLVACVAVPTREDLHHFTTEEPWVTDADFVETALVTRVHKRSGVRVEPVARDLTLTPR